MLKEVVFGFLITTFFLSCNTKHINHFKNPSKIGQTVTSDMVFMPGTEKVPPFYVGISEEPNINYVAYLQWLRRVYVDYPEVAKNAEIHSIKGEIPRFNDPQLVYHMEHPAFAYYPIVGATWYQIQDYLQWKTNRVNEAILIELDLLSEDPNQINEACFVTESYLYRQGDGLMLGKKTLRDESTKNGTRLPVWQDGILLPQYRLPTEAEWELLHTENEINGYHTKYPYGKEYPILRWVRGKYSNVQNGFEENSTIPNYDYHWKRGIIPDPRDYPNYKQGIQGPYLHTKSSLPSNVAGNVKEWVLDIYRPEPLNEWKSYKEYFERNGFITHLDSMSWVYDQDGIIDLKDSLGRLPFKIYGTNVDGSPMWVIPPTQKKRKEFVGFALDTTLVVEPTYKYKTMLFDNFFNEFETQLTLLYQNRVNANEMRLVAANKEDELLLEWLSILEELGTYSYRNWGQTSRYAQLNGDSVRLEVKSYYKKKWDQAFKDPAMKVGMLDAVLYVELDGKVLEIRKKRVYRSVNHGYNNKGRLIRGGTWKKPDFTNRELMNPDSSSTEVGFRCVMPYISTPVKKNLKVRWD